MKIEYCTRILDRIHAALRAAEADGRKIKEITLEYSELQELKSDIRSCRCLDVGAGSVGLVSALLERGSGLTIDGVPIKVLPDPGIPYADLPPLDEHVLRPSAARKLEDQKTPGPKKCATCIHLEKPAWDYPCSFCQDNWILPSWSLRFDKYRKALVTEK